MKTGIAFRLASVIPALSLLISCSEKESITIDGDLITYHPVTVSITGPDADEEGNTNPFLNYRLDIQFFNKKDTISVPGYFAADGNSSETSSSTGDIWRAIFMPPFPGKWDFRISFREGKNISISNNPAEGKSIEPDGYEGSFIIEKKEYTPEDPQSAGRLTYTGERYLKYSVSGKYFLKGGADSPENFLGYRDFDGTYYGGNNKTRSGEAAPNSGLHLYEPHIKDWKEGDPQWQGGKGKGIIGALNYLSSKGMNSFYFLTLNILGDGEDVWPYTDRNERYRFDCSKLDQWEKVFSHADKLGVMMHFVLQETENECLLDCGYLDVQRKLYLRELVARFAHHNAITWNLGEEHGPVEWSPYGQTYADTKKMADYLREIDPYDNFIVIHTHSNKEQRIKDMTNYLGFRNIEGPSIQCGTIEDVHSDAIHWIKSSGNSGHQWVVSLDEIGQHWKGALPDEYDPAHDTIRHKVLYGNLMAGGAGVEWYFGYKYPHSDLSCEDWRSRDKLWEQTKFALDLFSNHLPFSEMINADELVSDPQAYCLASEGKTYAVYLPEGRPVNIKVTAGDYKIRWFNPRTGGELIEGNSVRIKDNETLPTGEPPVADSKDWICLISGIIGSE